MPHLGRVAALSVSQKKGVPKHNVSQAHFVPDWGIKGDAHAGPGHRQVSLLALESIKEMEERGAKVRPGIFGENITTVGVPLTNLQVGDRIRIGGVELQVTQLGKECVHPCSIFAQVGYCIMPEEGVFAKVIGGGTAHLGEQVTFERAEP